MSGSEITDKIEEFTEWRPSPGSIYPLLSHMKKEGLIQSHEDHDPNLKRFKLTENGEKEFTEIIANKHHIKNRNRSIRKMYWRLHLGMDESLYTHFGNLANELELTYLRIMNNEVKINRLKEVLSKAVNDIAEIRYNE
jgi:DNA-binding PadR family transcriptional regulator